jgi:hypothetical protein
MQAQHDAVHFTKETYGTQIDYEVWTGYPAFQLQQVLGHEWCWQSEIIACQLTSL